MEETKKSSKGLIVLIIILIICILGLGGYIVYDKVFNKNKSIENKKTSQKNQNSLINNILPNDMSNYYQILWDYEYLYNKYFTMKDDNEEKYLCNEEGCSLYNKFTKKTISNSSFKPYNFVKIEKNKLYWKVDNNWIQDDKITNDIKLFYIDAFEETIQSFIIINDNNETYRIILEKELSKLNDENEYILTKEIYSSYKYNKIDGIKSINNIKFVGYPIECEAKTLIYFELENGIFVLDGNQLVEVEKFIKNYYKEEEFKYINYLYNTCTPDNGMINIKYVGILENIKNENNTEIKIKFYIKLDEGYYALNDANSFDIIIDDKNNLYVIDRNKINDIKKIKTLEVFAQVKKINLETSENDERIIKNIELKSGEKIILKK